MFEGHNEMLRETDQACREDAECSASGDCQDILPYQISMPVLRWVNLILQSSWAQGSFNVRLWNVLSGEEEWSHQSIQSRSK